MGTKHTKKRRLVRSLFWLTAAGILWVLLLPLWFPWLLRPVANHYGLGFSSYDRIGWSRFALTDVHGDWNGTRLKVQRAESVLPTTWLWHRFQKDTNGTPLLFLSDGHLMIAGESSNTVTPANPEAQGSSFEALNQTTQLGLMLQQWLPVAELTNFTIQISSNQVSLSHALWRAGRLQAVVQPPSARGEMELAAHFDGDAFLGISAEWKAFDAAFQGEFSRDATGWHSVGELKWLTNRAAVKAEFRTNGWWPTQARMDFPRWQLPAELFHLEGYENLIASLTANLVSNRFELQATGFAQPSPASARAGFPSLNFAFGADGDPNGVKLHTLTIQSPWLNADLTNIVGLARTGELLAEPAQLRLSVDLEKLPGATITGTAEGVIRIQPQATRPPVVQFEISADGVTAGPVTTKRVFAQGEFLSPMLKFTEIRSDFADGSVLVADGSYDGKAQRIAAGHWRLSGKFLETVLPGLNYSGLVASGEIHGPLTNLTHRGQAALTTGRLAGLKPFDAQLKWSGQNYHFATAAIEWAAGEAVLSIGVTADLNVPEHQVGATLNQLSLRRGNEELYKLAQPCAISFRAGNTNFQDHRWALAVNSLNWRSELQTISGTADLAWPAHGEATLAMTNVAAADFSDFFETDLANILVTDLAATAHWSNGPVHAVIAAAGTLTDDAAQIYGLRATVKTAESLFIEKLTLESVALPPLSVTGTLPIQVLLERHDGVAIWDESQQIALVGNWQENAPTAYSVSLGSRGQLELFQPELSFQVSGTLYEPAAELRANATKLVWQTKTNNSPQPNLADVHVAVEIRPDAVRMKTFTAKLDGQPITATGEWPLPAEAWRQLWSNGNLPDWNQARGSLELNGAQVAALAVYLPAVLAPDGQLNATLALRPGKRLEGTLTLTNAATRPMGTITPLRDIAALIRLEGNRARLEDFRAQFGGQPVRADGFVTIPGLDGSELDYQVNLFGTNVPLVRSPEFLLRGDFAMSLQGGSNLPPLVSGVVALHDGLYVQHASALVRSGVRRPEWRPPYFSVTNEPFADWKLDLAVRGDRFLRARTPVLSGIASADFQLRGSLRAPLLTGDARVNSGRLLFPFGSLRIDQGFVSFSGNDPQGPEVQVNGSGRNYDYELRLEVKGPADGADVLFSSTPPLTSEEILLMLTAGEMPQSEFNFSSGTRAGRLATFLGKDLLSRYLGSDPAEERLVIRTGESISEEGRLTYSLEYRLTDRWSIIGEYDEFNAFNTDLKWKIFAR